MIQEIELSKLKVHPRNVRKTYKGIDELAESIKAQGIRQNLTVVKNPEGFGTYWVVIGNRRLKAAIKAGIETAPCEVVEMDEKEQLETMKMENDIVAPQDGTIASINVSAGDAVESGAVMATLN